MQSSYRSFYQVSSWYLIAVIIRLTVMLLLEMIDKKSSFNYWMKCNSKFVHRISQVFFLEPFCLIYVFLYFSQCQRQIYGFWFHRMYSRNHYFRYMIFYHTFIQFININKMWYVETMNLSSYCFCHQLLFCPSLQLHFFFHTFGSDSLWQIDYYSMHIFC